MAQWVRRYKSLQNPHVQVVNEGNSLDFQVHHNHVVDNTKIGDGVTWKFYTHLLLFFIINVEKLQKALFSKEKYQVAFLI